MAVSKSNHVEKIAPSSNSAVPMRRDGRSIACIELKNRIRARPHVRLGHGSKDTAHVRLGHGSKDTAHVRLGHGSKDMAHAPVRSRV